MCPNRMEMRGLPSQRDCVLFYKNGMVYHCDGIVSYSLRMAWLSHRDGTVSYSIRSGVSSHCNRWCPLAERQGCHVG
jgi:hypothetical protein